MAHHPEHLNRLKKSVTRMMLERGYTLSEEDDILNRCPTSYLVESFAPYVEGEIRSARAGERLANPVRLYLRNSTPERASLRHMLSTYYEKVLPGTSTIVERCVVYFASAGDKEQLPVEEIRVLCRLMTEAAPADRGIIISHEPISSQANRELRDVQIADSRGIGKHAQHFQDIELLYNPIDHVYTAKHTLLSDTVARELITTNGIKLGQMPKIRADDPQIKRLGGLPGQIVRLERQNLVAETLLDKELSYRVVAPPVEERKK